MPGALGKRPWRCTRGSVSGRQVRRDFSTARSSGSRSTSRWDIRSTGSSAGDGSELCRNVISDLEKLRKLRYGSDLVNVVADARQEHGPGLGTFGFDDEGVAAQCTPIITNGLFTGYLSSRETAHTIGESRSGGTLRAEGWNRLPMIRMTNISLLPGEKPLSLEQLIAGTDHGILMQTNRSWSIDDKRYNFQFGCEIGWEIKNGKRVRMVKNPSYSGITTEFWNSLDAICSRDEWTLWGTPNCGQGAAATGDGDWTWGGGRRGFGGSRWGRRLRRDKVTDVGCLKS